MAEIKSKALINRNRSLKDGVSLEKDSIKMLENIEANQITTIPLGTGNKSSRIVAWTFLSLEEQKEWRETRWKTNS